MIPIVDARSGKVVQVGQLIEYPPTIMLNGKRQRAACRLDKFTSGVFGGKAVVTLWEGERQHTQVVQVPIRWFPKLTYGPNFPVDAVRVAILPS